MSKKFLFFIVLFISTGLSDFTRSEIVPLKKPIQTKEETQKKLLIDVLKPLPKPIKKTVNKEIEKKVISPGQTDSIPGDQSPRPKLASAALERFTTCSPTARADCHRARPRRNQARS